MDDHAVTPTTSKAKPKEGFGYKVLLKLAGAIGIGWQVMLVLLRIAAIVVGIIAGIAIGLLVLFAVPDATGLLIAAAFIAPPVIIVAIAEFWIWMNSDPITAWITPY